MALPKTSYGVCGATEYLKRDAVIKSSAACPDHLDVCLKCGGEWSSTSSRRFCENCRAAAKRDAEDTDPEIGVNDFADTRERPARAERSSVTGKPYGQHVHRNPYDEESGG